MKIPGFTSNRDKKSTSTRGKSYFLIPPLALWHPWWHQFMDWMVIFLTVMLCLIMLPTRLPGMELLGIGPNWLLIWVVAWSVNRSVFSGLLSGIILGLLQDAMTSPNPTHALGLGIVGMLTALMQKQRFIQEDFISIALIVFVMAVVADTIFAFQLSWEGNRHAASIWTYYQRATLASAILSSLWAPVVYYPLNRWWQQMKLIRNS
ncbi:rod shape-determining protein MreD [Aphanizomenon sp. PH219]|jgi:rod shape-determining protein MreD|uniref:rod shape-determining protein MreD n=1 Tax=Aphanizomenon flos-aquae TaxID=1176 RepID=UPI0004824CDF|nr:rod shape-determining protein MreD [Aphanizomenon flos-aquae]MDK2410544.1 rod shape-determining protein MreD [Aphanizomenon sp. 202]MDK2461335.1 rod shape-determining protein MreD [Aphanizomenon sp. PH219]